MLRNFLILSILGSTMTSAFADYLTTDVKSFFKDGKAPNGAWVNGANGGKFQKTEIDGQTYFKFTTQKSKQQACWGFHGHKRLNPADLPDGKNTLKLRLKLKSLQPIADNINIAWGWRGEKMQLLKAASTKAKISHQKWTDVILPMADFGNQKKLSGFYFSCDKPGTYLLSEVSLIAQRKISLDDIPDDWFFKNDNIVLKGSATKNIKQVELEVTSDKDKKKVLSKILPVQDGKFSIQLAKKDLAQYYKNTFVVSIPGDNSVAAKSIPESVFVFPEFKNTPLPKLTIKNGKLLKGKNPFAFVAANYTRFTLNFPPKTRPNYELLARDAKMFSDWGISALRLSFNIGMIQPAEGIFPDNPEWEKIIAKHKCNTHFMDMVDYFFKVTAENGIYCIIDWHSYPTDPYRYFLGGNNHEKGKKPGTAISWLASDKFKGESFNLSKPKHLNALLTTHSWMAKHLKGQSNIMGFEVPYNEPHDKFMSVQSTWSRIVSQCAMAIKKQDPDRLTFSNVPNYAHNNEAWAYTWLTPFGIDGQGPHHYIANGPVPVRPEASKTKKPWLCRDIEQTFAYSLPALWFPAGVNRQPVYNGEGGEWGAEVLLKGIERKLAEEYMYEASLFQCYVAGVIGHFNWMCIDNKKTNLNLYKKYGPRYAKVMKAGPIDWSKAKLALIQNTEAVPSNNGHNFACVPFVKLMLDLHLGPVHYLPDDMIIYKGLSRVSAGLEQVEGLSASSFKNYQAVIVDRRNLDQRVEKVLKNQKTPILWVDDLEKLTPEQLIKFLKENNLHYDTKTPAGIQMAIGPKHLVIYRRKGESGISKIYPLIERENTFKLVDERGKTVYSGNSEKLSQEGLSISLDKWRSKIFTIEN